MSLREAYLGYLERAKRVPRVVRFFPRAVIEGSGRFSVMRIVPLITNCIIGREIGRQGWRQRCCQKHSPWGYKR